MIKVYFPILLTTVVFVSTATSAQVQPPERLSPTQLQSIRALIEKTIAAHKVPGATFAVGLAGQLAWWEGFGYSDVENHVKALPEMA
jgi:CubicO group peptidase (beta-lactamase class C family)